MTYVFLNNKIIPSDQASLSIHDHGFLYGDGIYETILQTQGHCPNLPAHLTRLQSSANQAYLKLPKLNFTQIIQELIQKHNYPQSRIRITLTRGANHFNFTTCPNPTILITETEMPPLPTSYHLTSLAIERPVPQLKTISRISENLARHQAEQDNCQECLLINRDGFITEGSISNLFYIKNQTIFYPKSENHLPGTSQKLVFQAAKKLSIPTQEQEITLNHLYQADEIFISNALIQIMPVTKLHQQTYEIGKTTSLLQNHI